jgi:cytochrome c peroxidase
MRPYFLRISVIVVIFLLVGLFLQFHSGSKYTSNNQTEPVVGNVDTFLAGYERWKETAKQSGADRNLVLGLGYDKGLSFKFTSAHGVAKLDLTNGSISVNVSNLPDKEAFDVWLVDNQPAPEDSVKPEPWDKMVRIGSLKQEGKTSKLEAHLDREALKDFKLDLVVIEPSGKTPGEADLLFGSPSIYQQLYYSEQRKQFVKLGLDSSSSNSTDKTLLSAPFNFLIPSLAVADQPLDIQKIIKDEMAKGADLFFNETFKGNGRTCGTCHPLENNFTLDPAFIATLPKKDPLFVAEFNKDLKNLEKPDLMRTFGLILENVDGLDDPTNKFVMRGVPHTIGLTKSIARAANLEIANGVPAAEVPPTFAEMTGWSGDGSPGFTLLDFATGAVRQHFTKTLNRVPGKDFRFPTSDELSAMQAFQLSIGRNNDPNLSTLVLTSSDAQTGKGLFVNGTGNPLAGGRCGGCHTNAGALNGAGANNNNNTGVEDFAPAGATSQTYYKLYDPTIPRDGGFAGSISRNPAGCTGAPSTTCGFGNGTFNAVSVIEAADTPPFFHNNVVNSIEDAVKFFNSPQFNNPRAAGAKIQLDDTQAGQVAVFLRVINALDNINSAIDYENKGLSGKNFPQARDPLKAAVHELEDAINVLDEKGLHPDAVQYLMEAADFTEQASKTGNGKRRNELIGMAIEAGISAREDMCDPGSDAVLCPN